MAQGLRLVLALIKLHMSANQILNIVTDFFSLSWRRQNYERFHPGIFTVVI